MPNGNKSVLELERRMNAIQSDVAGNTKDTDYNLKDPKKISNRRKNLLDKYAENLNTDTIPYEATRRSLYSPDFKGSIGRGTIEPFGGRMLGEATKGALPWQDPIEYAADEQS